MRALMLLAGTGQFDGASASSIWNDAGRDRWRLRDFGGQTALEIIFRVTQNARNWYLDGEKAFAVEPQ